MDKDVLKASVAGITRHVGTVVAGVLVTSGVIDESMTQQVTGIIVGLGAVLWSIIQKKRKDS